MNPAFEPQLWGIIGSVARQFIAWRTSRMRGNNATLSTSIFTWRKSLLSLAYT
jgi:hypothetical protein